MTTDIHAIIAAAKRVHHQQPFDKQDAATYIALRDHAIAMAEALARIAYDANEMNTADIVLIARACLAKIVRETNRG